MNLKNMREGLEIFSRYFDKPDGYHLGAEHDAIYVYATSRPLEPDDLQKVIDLGWNQKRENYDEDFAAKHYQPDEGWYAFV